MKEEGVRRERRDQPRYRIRKNAIAVVRPGSTFPGQVTEVSRTGLVFLYPDTGTGLGGDGWIDVLVADFQKGLHLQGVPVKTVSDRTLGEGGGSGGFPLRKRVVTFEKMSLEQRAELEFFLRVFTGEPL